MRKVLPRSRLQQVGLFLDSKYFFALVIIIFLLQALWIAWSFVYPMLYDEYYHYRIIEIFSTQWSPFIQNQPPEYDHLRDLSNETSFLFHYLMSYPLRLFKLFIADQYYLAFILRIINVAFVGVGLFGFYKLFQRVGIAKRYINIGLLLFATLPIVSFVAATINYDNMLFAVVPFFLIAAIQIISVKKVSVTNLLTFLSLGFFGSLIKYTFLPLFATVAIFVLVYLLRIHKKQIFKQLTDSFRTTKKIHPLFLLTLTATVVSIGLFSAVYLKNVVVYGTPSPSCQRTLDLERCMKSGIVKRNLDALATKDQRVAERLPDYTMSWITAMWKGSMTIARVAPSGIDVKYSPSLYYSAVFFSVFIVGASLMYGIGKGLFSTRSHLLLIVAAIAVIVAVYLFNANGYYKANIAFANQARYLLTAMPIIIVFGVYSFAIMLRKFAYVKYAVLGGVFIILTIGGGILTPIIVTDGSWYRPDGTVQAVNAKLKKAAGIIVIENIRR